LAVLFCILVNVLGVVRKVGASAASLEKKELEITDSADGACLLTLWGILSKVDFAEGDVVLVHDAKVSDFKSVSLASTVVSQVLVKPPGQEESNLRAWAKDANLSLGPLVDGRRGFTKFREIVKSGMVRGSITKLYYDRKMTFSKDEKLQAVVRLAMKEPEGDEAAFTLTG